MKRPFALALAAPLMMLPAFAQEGDGFSLKDYPQRVDEAIAACGADAAGAACRVQMMSILPTTVDALSFLGYEGSYDAAAPLLRQYAASAVPEVRAAAIYALARLGPKTEDFAAIRNALLSPVSGVRRAAIGALKLLPDAQAQELYARATAGYMPSGYFGSDDPLPFTPADTGIAPWPDKPRFLFFERGVNNGTYVFTTAQDAASTVALFEQQAGAKAVGMGEMEARFGAAHGDLLKPWIDRNQTIGAVQAIVLKDTAAGGGDPASLILVYEDYALGATGFALVRLPGEQLPRPRTAEAAPPALPAADPANPWWSFGAFTPKDGAAADDVAAWQAVIDTGGALAQAYLEKFPNGAYRTEAEAYLGGPGIATDLEVYSETEQVNVTWRNLPAGEDANIVVTMGSPDDQSLYNNIANEDVEVSGAEGSGVLFFSPYTMPGVYDVRVVQDGEALATTQVRIALREAQLSLEKTAFKPGEEIKVAFKGMQATPKDVISIAKKGDEPDRMGNVRVETGGAADGSVTLKAPNEPGEYEIRAWFNGESRPRGKLAFTVKGPDQPPEIADTSKPGMSLAADTFDASETILVRYAGFTGKGDYIAIATPGSANTVYLAYVSTKDAAGTIELKLPPEPGTYELRAFPGGRTDTIAVTVPITLTPPPGTNVATLTLDKPSYAPGETIMVSFKNMSTSSNDYVAVVQKGSRYSTYVSFVYTKGAVEGQAELKAPKEPGEYEIRAFFAEDESVLRGSVPLVVAAP